MGRRSLASSFASAMNRTLRGGRATAAERRALSVPGRTMRSFRPTFQAGSRAVGARPGRTRRTARGGR